MDRAQRDAVRERLRTATRRGLQAALEAVLEADAAAQKTAADRSDELLGWFADGTDTAVGAAWNALTDGAELPAAVSTT